MHRQFPTLIPYKTENDTLDELTMTIKYLDVLK